MTVLFATQGINAVFDISEVHEGTAELWAEPVYDAGLKLFFDVPQVDTPLRQAQLRLMLGSEVRLYVSLGVVVRGIDRLPFDFAQTKPPLVLLTGKGWRGFTR